MIIIIIQDDINKLIFYSTIIIKIRFSFSFCDSADEVKNIRIFYCNIQKKFLDFYNGEHGGVSSSSALPMSSNFHNI